MELTRREIEVLGLAAEGYTNKGIARRLWVAENTVKSHLEHSYRKLAVDNRTAAVARALRLGLLPGARR